MDKGKKKQVNMNLFCSKANYCWICGNFHAAFLGMYASTWPNIRTSHFLSVGDSQYCLVTFLSKISDQLSLLKVLSPEKDTSGTIGRYCFDNNNHRILGYLRYSIQSSCHSFTCPCRSSRASSNDSQYTLTNGRQYTGRICRYVS